MVSSVEGLLLPNRMGQHLDGHAKLRGQNRPRRGQLFQLPAGIQLAQHPVRNRVRSDRHPAAKHPPGFVPAQKAPLHAGRFIAFHRAGQLAQEPLRLGVLWPLVESQHPLQTHRQPILLHIHMQFAWVLEREPRPASGPYYRSAMRSHQGTSEEPTISVGRKKTPCAPCARRIGKASW